MAVDSNGKPVVDMEKIEKEGKSFAQKLREDFHTEEAHRVETQIKELN